MDKQVRICVSRGGAVTLKGPMVAVQGYSGGSGREDYLPSGGYGTGGGGYSPSRGYVTGGGKLPSSPTYVEALKGHYAEKDGDAGSLGGLYVPVKEYEGRYASLQGSTPPEVEYAEDYGGGYGPERADTEDYEDDDYVFLWPWVDPLERLQSAADRQSLSPADPLFMAAVVGIGLVVLLPLFIVAGVQLSPVMAPKLENHKMCGITTGGQVG